MISFFRNGEVTCNACDWPTCLERVKAIRESHRDELCDGWGSSRDAGDAFQPVCGTGIEHAGRKKWGSIDRPGVTCRFCDWLEGAMRHSDWRTETLCWNLVILRRDEGGREDEAAGCSKSGPSVAEQGMPMRKTRFHGSHVFGL